ncbi:hypothetical protein [Bacillus kexueae]|uniref:hypothetical protein n=1 Tax=Aeribacillus kexueae TaxID=2078952 RepID=UPI001FB02F91|nr:hypothetical protein [Bacillus kexueae]
MTTITKKNLKKIIIGFLCIFGLFIAVKYALYNINMVDDGDVVNELTRVMQQNNHELSLENELDFEWSEVYIFQPYTPEDSVKEIVGVEWISPHTSFFSHLMGFSSEPLLQDSQKRMIFLNKDKVVKDIIYNETDFDILSNHMNSNELLTLQEKNKYKVKRP